MNSLLTLAYKASQIVWKVFHPITVGVRVLLVQDGKFLLVKPSYQNHWTLPGGGIEPGETLEQSARREISEEAGALVGELHLFGAYTSFQENKNDHVVVFCGALQGFEAGFHPDAEIEQSGLFALQDLPPETAPGVRRRIEEYLGEMPGPFYGMW